MPNFVKTYCSFCNAKADSGDFITMEIMKKYRHGSLNKYINKLELSEVINILKQLLLAQLYIFNKTGFLHNDIHLGNILVKKSKEDITLNYKINIIDNNIPINKHRINIITNFLPLISDFDRGSIYNQPHITEEEYNEKNINIEKYINFSKKNLRSFYKKNYNYEKYINEESKNMLAFSCMLINLLETNSTSDWF
jgi:predicted unusual protein kinase regulating ubiquinone biosynthesis (AarF/ABC1/UbiB family)